MGKMKFYVVWKGRKRGIFSSWEECSASVKRYVDAEYIAFPSRELAEQAFRGRYADYRDGHARAPDSIAVDDSSIDNPGPIECRSVQADKGRLIFRQGPIPYGTNKWV
jgi:ribonuclease HI